MTDVTKTCRDISELKGVAQEACNLFLSECKKAGISIFITETYRSQERQNYLYKQGRTSPYQNNAKVTWTLSSRHTSRLAWDIAVNKPKDLYDSKVLAQAGKVAAKLGITWGGTWTDSVDYPHFEITSSWKAPKGSSSTPPTTPKQEEKKETVKMYKPSNETFLNETLKVLQRLEDKSVHGDKALSPTHREKLLKGELSESDATAIFYVAISRGMINGGK